MIKQTANIFGDTLVTNGNIGDHIINNGKEYELKVKNGELVWEEFPPVEFHLGSSSNITYRISDVPQKKERLVATHFIEQVDGDVTKITSFYRGTIEDLGNLKALF